MHDWAFWDSDITQTKSSWLRFYLDNLSKKLLVGGSRTQFVSLSSMWVCEQSSKLWIEIFVVKSQLMTFIRHWQVNLMTVNLGPGQHSHFLQCFPLGRMLVDCCMLSRNISKTAAIIWSGSGGLCLSFWGNLDHSPFFVSRRKVKGSLPFLLEHLRC